MSLAFVRGHVLGQKARTRANGRLVIVLVFVRDGSLTVNYTRWCTLYTKLSICLVLFWFIIVFVRIIVIEIHFGRRRSMFVTASYYVIFVLVNVIRRACNNVSNLYVLYWLTMPIKIGWQRYDVLHARTLHVWGHVKTLIKREKCTASPIKIKKCVDSKIFLLLSITI